TSFTDAIFSANGNYLLACGVPTVALMPRRVGSAPPIPTSTGLVLLDASSAEPIREFEVNVKTAYGYSRPTALALSANNCLFAAAMHDSSICVYELATGYIVRTFRGHRNEVTQLAFTADGRRLVSTSRDMTGL